MRRVILRVVLAIAFVLAPLLKFWRDILGLPGTISDVGEWREKWWPWLVQEGFDIMDVLANQPAMWGLSLLAGVLLVLVSWPEIKTTWPSYFGQALEVHFSDSRRFHFRAQYKGDEYDCYFLAIRKATDQTMHSVRVRIIRIEDAERLPVVDLLAINWFDPYAVPGPVDLAPRETRRFQFVFQMADQSANFGIRFGRTAGFTRGVGFAPYPITISAFSNDTSTMAELKLFEGITA